MTTDQTVDPNKRKTKTEQKREALLVDIVTIGERFCGPPNSGNGGYACGKMAEKLEGQVEATLMAPPPLGQELIREKAADGTVTLALGDKPIAKAHESSIEIIPPTPPTFEEAEIAMKSFVGFEYHTFPSCFVCGPDRGSDGLRLFPGPVEGKPDMVATTWVPNADLADESGNVDPIYLWSALDCPSAFVFDYKDLMATGKANVLGRLTAEVCGQTKPGDKCIVIGWKIGDDGRKHFSGSAVYGENGDLVAKAKATWITIDVK